MIGNYGMNTEDVESGRVQVSALLVREYQPFLGNHRSCGDLAGYLKGASVPGIEGLDTWAVARHIREIGAMRAFVST